MQAQLQDGRDLAAGLALDLGEPVDVPRIEHQRLLADRIGIRAQREAAVRVVQVVGRADRDVVDLLAAPAQLVDVTVEALELDEEVGIREIAVDDADRVLRVEGDLEIAVDRLDGAHVPRRDVAGGADQGESLPGIHGMARSRHATAARVT